MDLDTQLKQDAAIGVLNMLCDMAIADHVGTPWMNADLNECCSWSREGLIELMAYGLVIQQILLEADVADRTYRVLAEQSGVEGMQKLLTLLESELSGPPAWPPRAILSKYRASAAGIEIGHVVMRSCEAQKSDAALASALVGEALQMVIQARDQIERREVDSFAVVRETKLIPPEPLAYGLTVDRENGEIKREGYNNLTVKLSANIASIVYELAKNHGLLTRERLEAVCEKLGINSGGTAMSTAINKANLKLREVRLQIKKNKRGKGKHGGAYRLLELPQAKITK